MKERWIKEERERQEEKGRRSKIEKKTEGWNNREYEGCRGTETDKIRRQRESECERARERKRGRERERERGTEGQRKRQRERERETRVSTQKAAE